MGVRWGVGVVLWALTACTGPDAKDSETETSGETGGETAAVALNGTVPSEAIPAPEFTVRAQDQTVRSREDLLGHPTVMWFYPRAGTSG